MSANSKQQTPNTGLSTRSVSAAASGGNNAPIESNNFSGHWSRLQTNSSTNSSTLRQPNHPAVEVAGAKSEIKLQNKRQEQISTMEMSMGENTPPADGADVGDSGGAAPSALRYYDSIGDDWGEDDTDILEQFTAATRKRLPTSRPPSPSWGPGLSTRLASAAASGGNNAPSKLNNLSRRWSRLQTNSSTLRQPNPVVYW